MPIVFFYSRWAGGKGLKFCCIMTTFTALFELCNYVISRQIVERRVMSDCYLNIVVSLDC